MCNDDASRDEAHTELPRQHRQDVGLLLAIQSLAALDKTIHRFRSKRLRAEIFHISKEGATGTTSQHYERDSFVTRQSTEDA